MGLPAPRGSSRQASVCATRRTSLLRPRRNASIGASVADATALSASSYQIAFGAGGAVPGLANVDPAGYVRMWDAAVAGDWDAARKEQARLNRLFDIVFTPAGLGGDRRGRFVGGHGRQDPSLRRGDGRACHQSCAIAGDPDLDEPRHFLKQQDAVAVAAPAFGRHV